MSTAKSSPTASAKPGLRASAKRPARHVLEVIAAEPWAITEAGLEQILAIASRETPGIEAIEAELGQPLDYAYDATVRDGIATIRLQGPLFRYANLFTRFSGATSMEIAAKDFGGALKDPAVRGIVLAVDSPGGMVSGTSEFAELIYQARTVKPVVAHIDGMGASAAYWLASAAAAVTVSDTSLVGSIGALMVVRPAEPDGSIEFVSSQSPFKSLDPAQELGRAQRQRIVDAFAERFIEAVARNRGVSVETVKAEFGQGDVFVGPDAVAAGLVDGVSTFEAVHAALVEQTRSFGRGMGQGFGPGLAALALGPAGAHGIAGLELTLRGAPEAQSQHDPHEETDMSGPTGKSAGALTVEQLTAQYPEQVEAIRAAARTEGKAEGHAEGKAAGVAEGLAQGVAQENKRLLAIEALAIPGAEQVIAEAKADPSVTPEAVAMKVIPIARQTAATGSAKSGAGAQHLQHLSAAEGNLDAPPVQPDAGAEPSAAQAQVTSILAAHRPRRSPAAARSGDAAPTR